jgi:hypothetical protein
VRSTAPRSLSIRIAPFAFVRDKIAVCGAGWPRTEHFCVGLEDFVIFGHHILASQRMVRALVVKDLSKSDELFQRARIAFERFLL